MYTAPKNVYRDRVDFSKIKTSIPIPNLIEIQKNSYERFLQMRVLPGEREDAGLQSVFKSVFPITDLRENCSLEFVEYSIGNWECKCGRLVGLDKLGRPCTFCAATIIIDPAGDREIHCPKCGHLNENTPLTCDTCDEPVGLKLKYDVDECQERGMTFAVPLKVTIRLVVWDKDPDTGAKTIRDIKEQEVYFGDIPLMTENGTFIINGTERVIVSQLPPLAGRLLLPAGEGTVRGPDHPLPRELGGVRVRLQEPAARPHRPQAEVPGHRCSCARWASRPTPSSSAASTSGTASWSARASSSGRPPRTWWA
jgi:DNA-directed RNA polymerase beta subunit